MGASCWCFSLIRVGTYDDLEQIVIMAREFWGHTIFDDPFCAISVEEMAKYCIDQGLMVVLDVDGPKGFACAIAGHLLANVDVKSGTEVAWWVNPEHRGGRNGISLIKALESQAKEVGIKWFSLAFMESSMPDKIEDIYLKMGYKKSETLYTKVL